MPKSTFGKTELKDKYNCLIKEETDFYSSKGWQRKRSSGFRKFFMYTIVSAAIVCGSMYTGVVKSNDIKSAYTNTVRTVKTFLGIEKNCSSDSGNALEKKLGGD